MRPDPLLLSIGCVLLFTGCAANGPAKSVGPEGGTIPMDRVAVVNVPAGAFAQPTKIELHQRELRRADKNVGVAELLFDIEQPATSELHLVADSALQPAKALDLQIDVPRDLRESLKNDDRTGADAPVLRVFAKNVWTSKAGDKLITLEPITGWSDPRLSTLHVVLPPYLFNRTRDNKVEATLRLALTQLPPAPVPPPVHPADSPIVSHDEMTASLMSHDPSLAPPLLGKVTVDAPFGITGDDQMYHLHPGVELTPDTSLGDAGRMVHAMADGMVTAAGEQVDSDGNQIGLSGFVVIGHGAMGAPPYTLYARLDPNSIRVAPDQTIHRGEVIGSVAAAPDETHPQPNLHLEYIPRPTSANGGRKTDPMARLGNVFVEHLVAGYRSSAIVRLPAADSNGDSIELTGNDADNEWWATRTKAKASETINGRTLEYQSKTGGEAETIVDENGLRVYFSTEGQPRVDAGKHDASNPSEANAAGTGGGRVRFMTAAPSHYRLHVRYSIEGNGDWSIEHRFQQIADASTGKPTEIDKDFTNLPASGKAAANVDKTFEGDLDAAGHYDFDFLPSIEVNGGSNRTAKLNASATLEVTPTGK